MSSPVAPWLGRMVGLLSMALKIKKPLFTSFALKKISETDRFPQEEKARHFSSLEIPFPADQSVGMIFDDNVPFSNEWMDRLFMNGRSYGIATISCSQAGNIPPMIRQQLDYVFIGRNSTRTLERIHDDFEIGDVCPLDEFAHLVRRITTERDDENCRHQYDSLVYDRTTTPNAPFKLFTPRVDV